MASAEREPIMGSGGFAPIGVEGQSPSLGCQEASKLNVYKWLSFVMKIQRISSLSTNS